MSEKRGKIKPALQVGGEGHSGKKLLFIFIVFFLSTLYIPNLAQAATITANVTETNINSTVLLTGAGFSPDTNYYLIPLLENKTAWWDGYKENWFFSPLSNNNTINVTTNGLGEFNYNLYIPNDWRVAGGKVRFKVGEQVASSLLWRTQGTYWAATQPTKNGITGDSNANGFVYAVSTAAAANQGGVEKFYKSNGALACRYNWTAAVTPNDITNNGSIAYVVTSATSNNLQRINMADCTLMGQQTTAGAASYSVNVAPNNEYIIITYAATAAPRKYMINVDPPTQNATFAPTLVASIGYDSCISPDGTTVYIGYASGNVTALNANTGALIWGRDIPEEELNNAGYAFPIRGLDCDNERVYVARTQVTYPTGIINQGFVEALWATNGSRAWANSKTDTVYDMMDVKDVSCDSSYCYAVKMITPAPFVGVVGSAIVQINKTNGNVTWQNWRSWLPTTYDGAYGSGGTHSSAQNVWVDTDTNGYLYPIYTNGWVQKISKNDVNPQTIETNLWIRGNTNFWNYVADVSKNIWLSNETPYYVFRHWNQQGMPLNTSATQLDNTFFRYSMMTSFNSFTAYEYTVASVLGNSIFINPVMQVAPTQRNEVQYFNNEYHASCPNTRYSPGLYGWHYQDRACHYEEIPATLAGWNIGTTINGTFITGVVYSLIKTKFWENYSITKYYGNDNWAWAEFHNTTKNQVVGFTTKFGSDQEDIYSDIYGRAVLFTNYGTTYYYRPQFRADLNRKTDNYIFFLPKTPDENNTIYSNGTMWQRVDIETQKVANPMNITLSNDESGSFVIGANTYSNRINFTAQEPDLFNRTNEPVEIIFNAVGGIRSGCQDVIITDNTDTPINLWQVDNFTSCSIGNNVFVWIMMDWQKNETKNLRLYYNSPSATPSASGTTDLVVTTASGACSTSNHEVNINSTNWYYWQRPAAATASNEVTRFNFDSSENLWASSTHYQVAQCYKNSNTTGTGAGAAADTCGTAAAVVSRCLRVGGTGKIFAKLNATVAVGAVAGRPSAANTLNVEYYFFANTGRVRLRTQLAEARPTMNTTVSKNWPPYYYFSLNGFIPGTSGGLNSWTYYSGLYEQMKKPVATFNADMTQANLSSSPLPLMFTIRYGDPNDGLPQANGSIFRPATVDGTNDFWDKGCTAHKMWQFYDNGWGGADYGTSAAPLYTSEFISCDKSLDSQLPKLGEPGYVNVIPEMAWYGTSVNRFFDPILTGKMYLKPNLYRPYNRENRFLSPYITSSTPAAVTSTYQTSRISSYIIPVCPTAEYGYKGYDDFLEDLPDLLADTENHIKENTANIPCAAQIRKWTDSRGTDGQEIIFAKNLTVIVGEVNSAGITYPFNTFAPGTYGYLKDGDLDLTFAQKGTSTIVTTGYFGKWYFTYTPENYIIHAFSTTGNPQLMTTPATLAPSTSNAVRYSFAPETGYDKHVFDESKFWDKTSQNFTLYRNPCWLGQKNVYGSTVVGHAFATTPATPGWAQLQWGGGTTYAATYLCPFNSNQMEKGLDFRPGWGSGYPVSTDVGGWNEIMVDGMMNFPGTGNPTEAGADTYYSDRHNALFDYKHSDDFNSVFESTPDLNQNEKTPNKQPWYCQISRKSNRSFCVSTSATSTLIYNYNPGGGLTTTVPWSAYWSSIKEISSFRNYFARRYFDTSAWLWSYANLLEISLYPTLSNEEVLYTNILYTSDNADDYSLFFQKQYPTAADSLDQTQFLLKDWKNSAFIVFSADSRHYAAGLPMSLTGIAISNGELLNNTNITLGIYSESDVLVQQISTTTNSSGMFNWTLTLPNSMSAGLYYVQFNYNNTIIDSAEFRIIGLIATTTSDQAAYEQGQEVQTTVTITNSYTGANTDPDQLELRYLNPSSSVVECAKYPNETIVSGCDNNLSKTDTGIFTYTFSIGSNPLGVYTQRATVTEDGIAADFDRGFVVALIDPCKANSAYDYALSYPLTYNNVSDVLTVIGNSSMGTSSNPITTEQMYEFAQATKGSCIMQKPATGTYAVLSQLVIGNGTQEVYVTSKGESIGFSSANMPELTINENAHLIFGGIADGIPQQGCSVKFASNASNDLLLDVSGGELAFYDSYITDVGISWGRFLFRGNCGNETEGTYSSDNSSITIKKTIFDRAARGQFFYTSNVTIDDMKLNRINSSAVSGYGIIAGCNIPALNNLQIYHQEQDGSAIKTTEDVPANTDLLITSSTLDYNIKDVVAAKNGRGVQLINTQWDRAYGFNWSGDWEGTTAIKESYGYNPTFVDTSSSPVANLTLVLINQYGNIEISQETESSGGIGEQYIPTWQVEKSVSGESESSFNPYTLYAKKYTKTFISEPKSFASRTLETKQVATNSFNILSEAVASAVKNITYNAPTKVSYGDEVNSSWTTSGQLANYPVDQCQYFALFANGTKLAETSNYTIDYETGEITFVQNMAGMEIKPVYFYGGDITITNGFTLTGAYSMSKIYDYMSYVTSKNNLSEDLITIDGINYQFCVNFVIGNDTHRGSVSDSSATISFKDGYDMSFSGLGGYVDLAGITSGGGSSGGLPLNIFDSVGSSYAPGNTVYVFSTVLNSNGQLVDATVSLDIYLPNGTLYEEGNMISTSTGRFQYNFTLPGDAQLGTWRINIDATYGGNEVHDNLAFMVTTSGGGGGGGGSTPSIQIDAPSIINTNENFGIFAFTRNNNSLLVNCDSGAFLTLKDTANGTALLNSVSMTNTATGKYNYTTSLPYQSTFLAEVTCTIGGTTYVSNPKIISSQNVPTNDTGGGGSAYPTIELLASTPIETSTTASIGALVKSSSGIVTNCDGSLGITIRNLADGTSSSGEMSNFGTGMYNYSWTTPATASVFYVNASCQISGTNYVGFTLLSTQDVGATATIDYNQIAQYVWNYTSRNLTWYNQSVAESMQNCLKDGECSGWWLNTTLTNIQNVVNIINSTTNQIKTDTETLLNNFNCTSSNEICTRLQNILNNATDIQSRVYSLNTSQIPALQTSIDNVYTDTQYIRTNMATASALQDVNSSVWWIRNNMVTQETFGNNMTDIRNRLDEINSTTQTIRTAVNCSVPANSVLCTYLDNINATVDYIKNNMATYSQVQNVSNDTQWIRENVATQEAMANNFTDVISRLINMNTTLWDVHDDLANVNTSLSNQISNVQSDVTWIRDNVATSEEINSNFTETFNRLSNINSTLVDVKDYLYINITYTLNELNTTTQNTYSYIMANVSTQANITEILNQINYVQENITYVKNNMFYQGNATGSFLVDYLATVYAEKNSRTELWILTRDLLGNAKTVSAAECNIIQKGVYITNATVSISTGSVYAYWDVPLNQTNGEYAWNCTLTGSTLNLYVPFFVSSQTSQFAISSLAASSPKYPNENAIIEATFSSGNGSSVTPDTINLTIYKPNYLTIWYSADKNDFSVQNGVWSWIQMIEASPTTGTYYVHMVASYNGVTSSKTTQFRIATGGPYKVYLECPESSYVGQNLVCSVILKDEGEVLTESTSTVWVDTNNNLAWDAGEPVSSFSKQTVPLQNVTQSVSINVPSSHSTGLHVVRVTTSYANSAQPDSTASDSVTFSTSPSQPSEGGPSGGGGAGGVPTIEIEEKEGKTQITDFPGKIEIIKTESLEKTIGIKNIGEGDLNNVKLVISGLPLDSYTIFPEKYDVIAPEVLATFLIKFKTELEEKEYKIKFIITSDEGSEEVSSVLVVKRVGEAIPEKEEEKKIIPEIEVPSYLPWIFSYLPWILIILVVLGILTYFGIKKKEYIKGLFEKKHKAKEKVTEYHLLNTKNIIIAVLALIVLISIFIPLKEILSKIINLFSAVKLPSVSFNWWFVLAVLVILFLAGIFIVLILILNEIKKLTAGKRLKPQPQHKINKNVLLVIGVIVLILLFLLMLISNPSITGNVVGVSNSGDC